MTMFMTSPPTLKRRSKLASLHGTCLPFFQSLKPTLVLLMNSNVTTP